MTKTARTVALLFGLALVVRLLFWGFTSQRFDDPPPVEDERGYVELTQTLVHGQMNEPRGLYMVDWRWQRDRSPTADGFTHPERVLPFRRDSFRGPVVPLLLAPVEALGGGLGWMRIVSIVLGALGAPMLFLALRTSPLGDHVFWPAAAYALWPPAIYVSVRAISEAPSQALLLGAMATLCIPRTRGGVFAGALAALSVLARPAALIPAALLALATGSKKRALYFAVAFVVVLAPWIVRNWTIHGRPLLTTNSGVTLVGGNSQAALDAEHPGKWVAPERVYDGDPDAPDLGMWGWSTMSEEASDRRFADDAVSWVLAKPLRAARLAFWKLVRLFDPDQHSGKADAASKAVIGWLTFAPVLLLAVLGLGAWRAELPWTMLLVGTIATALIFYGDVRMRTCADPALLVFAAHGASRLARRAADRNRGRSVV